MDIYMCHYIAGQRTLELNLIEFIDPDTRMHILCGIEEVIIYDIPHHNCGAFVSLQRYTIILMGCCTVSLKIRVYDVKIIEIMTTTTILKYFISGQRLERLWNPLKWCIDTCYK